MLRDAASETMQPHAGRAQAQCKIEKWRATADEDGHYVFAVAL
jgi:hypothetical protein